MHQSGDVHGPRDPRRATSSTSSGGSGRRPLQAALDIAAQSVLDSQVHGENVEGLVAERALDHHWEGLFQHAVVHVGPERATAVVEALAAARERLVAGAQEAEASTRARLYGALHDLIRAEGGGALAPGSSLWWEPGSPELRRSALALRRALSPGQRDVLELRYARGLERDEVAHVLKMSVAEVEAVERDALSLAERTLGARPESFDRTLKGALLEVFALHARRLVPPGRPARRSVLKVGEVVQGRYEVEAQLGAGAFADVYRARDREVSDHVVALKILRTRANDARTIEVALREVQLIASVFHPSVVQLKDHGWHDGHLWFVMPLYRGETLGQRLKRGPLGREEARRIFEPLAEALATMHRAGVLHQDIKPENVLLAELDAEAHDAPDQRRVLPVLLDLGVAAKNAELVLAGTPAYLAPEVAARFAGRPDPPVVGPKADVFSLALTLRDALDPGYREEVPGGTVDAFIAHRARKAPPMPGDGALGDLRSSFERWLNFSPDRRPVAEAFRRELAVLTRAQERRARRNALWRSVAPTAVAVLTLFGAAVYHLSREASEQRSEATQARRQVQDVSRSLEHQQSKRRELEEDVARLRDQYQQSRLTREQLATRLAETQGRLEAAIEALEGRVQELTAEREQSRRQREIADEARIEADQQRDELQRQLEAERGRTREVIAQLRAARDEVQVQRAALQEKEAQLQQLASSRARDAWPNAGPLPRRAPPVVPRSSSLR